MSSSMTPSEQLKNLSQFLDVHMLIHLLSRNVSKDSASLQEQLKATLAKADAGNSKTLSEQKAKADKLLKLLADAPTCEQLKREKEFTLEKLSNSHGITVEVCQAVFNYAKQLFEAQKYKDAEKYFFNLKEILVSELYTQTSLVCQVFWGLLACEILNQKTREVTELTTVRKIKDIIKTLYSDSPMQLLHHSSWLLHWILVFSFTAEKSNGLFAALLADKQNFGDTYLNVVQLRSPHLMRYMIAAFLLGRSSYQPQPTASTSRTPISLLQKDALQTIALPIVLSEKPAYSDVFTQFTESLLDDFDFENALELCKDIGDACQTDVLLKPHAAEIKRQAYLYVFEVQCRLFYSSSSSGLNMTEFCKKYGIQEEGATGLVETNLREQGLIVKTETKNAKGSTVAVEGSNFDVKGKIKTTTMELIKRTQNLHNNMQSSNSNAGASGEGASAADKKPA